jgi:hypothetical protein
MPSSPEVLTRGGSIRWRATLRRTDGRDGPELELVESEEGYVDHAVGASLAVRATYGQWPRFTTTVQVGPDRWTRSDRDDRETGRWLHHRGSAGGLGPARTEDLQRLAASMGESVLRGLGFVGPETTWVPVRYAVRDGALTGWSVEVDDLVEAATRLGHHPDPRLLPAHLRYEVTLDRVELPLRIAAPDAALVDELVDEWLSRGVVRRDLA